MEALHQQFNTNRRFAVPQPSSTDPDNKRAVDDCRASGDNATTILPEKMEMRGLEGLMDLIIFMMICFLEKSLHILAEDYEKAFEQLAIHPYDWANHPAL